MKRAKQVRERNWGISGRLGPALLCFAFASSSGCSPEPSQAPAATETETEASSLDDAPSVVSTGGAGGRRDILGTERNRHSQHDEELIIRDFFQDRENGFFLDVGCAWPVNYSNTYYLERHLGWSGFGVDALSDHERRWKNRRPRSKFFNYIVTDHSGTVETFYKTERGDLLGISTLHPGKGPGGENVAFEEVQVPTITLNELLDQNGVEKIDLLTMDIEGAEPAALAGFDIDRFKPELAIVEVHVPNRAIIVQYFVDHGYKRLAEYDSIDRANFYFAPAETAP